MIEVEDFGLGQFFEDLGVGAVAAGDGKILEELRDADVEGGVAHAAGAVGQGAGQIVSDRKPRIFGSRPLVRGCFRSERLVQIEKTTV